MLKAIKQKSPLDFPVRLLCEIYSFGFKASNWGKVLIGDLPIK